MLAGACTGQTAVPDEWRYVPASSSQGASAELGQMETYGFRVRCVPQRHELSFEYSPGDGGAGDWTEEARNSGIDLILYYATSGTETTYTVHGPVTANSVTGTLALTADLSDEITDAPQIMLYGENGPANRTFGGEAEALRRIVRECAPPRMAPRRPKIEEGHKRSDW